MTANRALHIIAGTFIMLSVALGHYVNPWFFAFTFFVGANLFQSGITNWCLMEDMPKKFGFR